MLLVVTTLIWATTFTLIKNTTASLSPAALVATRFTIAALIFVPFARRLNARLLLDGGVLGFLRSGASVRGCLLVLATR